MLIFNLNISSFTTSNLPWLMDLIFRFLCKFFFIALNFTFTTRHIHNWAPFSLWPSCCFISIAISHCPQHFLSSILDTLRYGDSPHLSYLFVFPYCLWGSPGKNTGVCCHFLHQWTLFCQNSSLRPIHLGWPYKAWLIASLSYASPYAMPWQDCYLWRFTGHSKSPIPTTQETTLYMDITR